METKLQTTTNQNGVIALEKYSELKRLILEKIAQEKDTEQVQKLTKLLFDIDAFLTAIGLSNLGSSSNLIKLLLTTFNKSK